MEGTGVGDAKRESDARRVQGFQRLIGLAKGRLIGAASGRQGADQDEHHLSCAHVPLDTGHDAKVPDRLTYDLKALVVE
jgi:hypothetical protein